MRYFFYGTLLDADVRAAVLGPVALDLRPATLHGYRRVGVVGATYPILVPHGGGALAGLLAMVVDPGGAARLRAYEGPDYFEQTVTVSLDDGGTAEAVTFLPTHRLVPDWRDWNLVRWQRRSKAAFVRRLRGR